MIRAYYTLIINYIKIEYNKELKNSLIYFCLKIKN